MDVSQAGLNLIASFEGWRAQLYNDVANNATIGYGHLVHAGPISAADRAGPFGKGITQAQGLALLAQDAARMVAAVNQSVKVPLTQNQFDALVSFTYNVGVGAFQGSTLLKKLNAGDYAGAQAQFAAWNKAGGQVVAGLVRRRAEEAALFGGGPAPKPVPKPSTPSGTGTPWCTRLLQVGCRGADVQHLQGLLTIPADGVFGPQTKAAVQAFQGRNGLTADGVVGPKTLAALDRPR